MIYTGDTGAGSEPSAWAGGRAQSCCRLQRVHRLPSPGLLPEQRKRDLPAQLLAGAGELHAGDVQAPGHVGRAVSRALLRPEPPAPSPGISPLAAPQIGFAVLFSFGSSLHALPPLCPSPPKPNAIPAASPGAYAGHPASLRRDGKRPLLGISQAFPSECRVLGIAQPLQERSCLGQAALRPPSLPGGSPGRDAGPGRDASPGRDEGWREGHAWTRRPSFLTRSPSPAAPTKTKTKRSASCSPP